MCLLLYILLLRDSGEAGTQLAIDSHGLGHHTPNVPGVGRQKHRGAGLGQLPKRPDIFLCHRQTRRRTSIWCSKCLIHRLESRYTVGTKINIDRLGKYFIMGLCCHLVTIWWLFDELTLATISMDLALASPAATTALAEPSEALMSSCFSASEARILAWGREISYNIDQY